MSWENEISDECECAELIQARSERDEARKLAEEWRDYAIEGENEMWGRQPCDLPWEVEK